MKREELKKEIKKVENKINNFNWEEEIKDKMEWLGYSREQAINSVEKGMVFLKATLNSYKKELARM